MLAGLKLEQGAARCCRNGVLCAASISLALPMSSQSLDVDAAAKLVKPIVIETGSALEFGELSIPAAGTCVYQVTPAGSVSASQGNGCQFVSGDVFPAEFTVACGDNNASVRFEVIYTDASPSGVAFSAPKDPMQIDGAPAGDQVQSLSCDADGISLVRAGGKLSVGSDAEPFEGRVGSIRLEASFE